MKIAATSRSPFVEIQDGHCLIKGECYPEDISELSGPIMKEIGDALTRVESFVLELELYYFNSSSAKLLFDIFDAVDEAAADGLDVQIKWNYRSDDDSMQEAGEDFMEDVENATFIMQEI